MNYTILAQLACGDWRQMTNPQNPREGLRFDTETEARAYLERFPMLAGWHTRCDAFHGIQKLQLCEVRA